MADDDSVDTVARTLSVAASAEPVLLTLNEHADPATDVALRR
jgi:hypothetical protein